MPTPVKMDYKDELDVGSGLLAALLVIPTLAILLTYYTWAISKIWEWYLTDLLGEFNIKWAAGILLILMLLKPSKHNKGLFCKTDCWFCEAVSRTFYTWATPVILVAAAYLFKEIVL